MLQCYTKMTLKILIAVSILCVLLIGCFMIINLNQEDKMEEKKAVYQGPVPEGYDEQHFRETGITKPLEIKE